MLLIHEDSYIFFLKSRISFSNTSTVLLIEQSKCVFNFPSAEQGKHTYHSQPCCVKFIQKREATAPMNSKISQIFHHNSPKPNRKYDKIIQIHKRITSCLLSI